MKLAIALMMAVGMAIARGRQAVPTSQTRSVWDGVYTEEQAKRGEALYAKECSSCHGEDLSGMDEASPLTGATFRGNWDGLTVGDLFERVRVSMPQGDPGRLPRQEIADVLAYVLQYNQFPVGETELSRQAEILKQIRFEAMKPGNE